MNPIHIAGGGLAGLSLAGALARRGVPVHVYEKSHYPRHKVCGEFITGLGAETRHVLELDPVLDDVCQHRRTTWFRGGRKLFSRDLPAPALGISRWRLDARLAERAKDAGAQLHEGAFQSMDDAQNPGWIDARGVSRDAKGHAREPRWIGLKAHLRRWDAESGLELHLGHRAYAGVSGIEGGRANVCLLLDPGGCPPAARRSLESVLGAVGLEDLGGRIRVADVDPASRTATAGVLLDHSRAHSGTLAIGDGVGMIAPFTGHGMALAFRSAALALPHVEAYARGRLDWAKCCEAVAREVSSSLGGCKRWARWLHPFLLTPWGQSVGAAGLHSGLLPWRPLYRLTHHA